MFSEDELEMIAAIREINGDDTLDANECLATYIEMLELG